MERRGFFGRVVAGLSGLVVAKPAAAASVVTMSAEDLRLAHTNPPVNPEPINGALLTKDELRVLAREVARGVASEVSVMGMRRPRFRKTGTPWTEGAKADFVNDANSAYEAGRAVGRQMKGWKWTKKIEEFNSVGVVEINQKLGFVVQVTQYANYFVAKALGGKR